jgi:hypothetical protein
MGRVADVNIFTRIVLRWSFSPFWTGTLPCHWPSFLLSSKFFRVFVSLLVFRLHLKAFVFSLTLYNQLQYSFPLRQACVLHQACNYPFLAQCSRGQASVTVVIHFWPAAFFIYPPKTKRPATGFNTAAFVLVRNLVYHVAIGENLFSYLAHAYDCIETMGCAENVCRVA